MPAFPFPLLIRAGILLAVCLALWGAWWRADHWCNAECRSQSDRANAAEKSLSDAQARATHLALLWSDAINHVEVVYRDKVEERTTRFADLRSRAANSVGDNAAGGIVLGRESLGLLRDIAGAANGAAPAQADSGPSAPLPESAGTSAQEWLTFAADAAEAYREAADKHLACVSSWNALRASQESQNAPQ